MALHRFAERIRLFVVERVAKLVVKADLEFGQRSRVIVNEAVRTYLSEHADIKGQSDVLNEAAQEAIRKLSGG